ncbi:thioesterase family protein [Bacillus sp. MUM 13]|uniref:acyl-CoA thioesterase n=1 Tax=Bacillus sp. MUM 13 TaxID=1678001 RepID=UPI0008F5C137|nr:thioesterase family protein [Bacillus sp. MUM 13]OIK04564.1 thioesterase [Bacillus sp. MUM 13]
MFLTKIQPRVSETDGVGHINNTSIPVWLEAGREEIFKFFTPSLDFKDWKMVIVNLNADYVDQIFYGREAFVSTWVQKIGNSSFVLYEEIHQEGRLCVKATAAYVNFNQETQSGERIPEHIRQLLSQHLYGQSEESSK